MCITKDTEEIKELMRKLNELAKRGEGGEADNARQKLINLMLKYDLDISEIDDLVEVRREIGYQNTNYSQILAHCIWDVKPNADIRENKSRRKLLVILMATEYIEVMEKYKHYRKAFKEESKTFLKAFIIKNRIGLNTPSTKKAGKKELTEDDIKALRMTGALDDNKYSGKDVDKKQLDSPKLIEE